MRRKHEKENNLVWRKLDNSAKIFPVSTGKKYSTVFRISAVLKEDINPDILKLAVNKVLEKFLLFKVRMRAGFFWYYLEYNSKEIIIEQEKNYPCKYIDPLTNNYYLFKVTYFEKKINIDINHVLTDGTGGIDFFKEIIYTYLEISHKEDFNKELRIDRKFEYNIEDSYIKNYQKGLKGNASSKKAYIIKGENIPLGAVAAIHEIIDLDKLKQVCKEKEVTVTQYLTAVLIYSIYEEKYKKGYSKKPIKICIPVNLKKYFNSITLSNFFSYITLEAWIKKDRLDTFEKILKFVKDDFSKRLTKEEIKRTMFSNVKLGSNYFIRAIPLFIKKVIVRLSYIEIRKYTTLTFSNVGRIGMIGEYRKYIDDFLFLIAPEPVEKIKCSACTFENKLVFTFTTILNDVNIEKRFYNFIKDQGINIKIESNGVLDVIS